MGRACPRRVAIVNKEFFMELLFFGFEMTRAE